MEPTEEQTAERLRRWRLVLGEPAQEGLGAFALAGDDRGMDRVLDALYDSGERKGGLGSSAPNVARWLGDIRTYFSTSVVQVMQQDALDRLGLRQMLLEPELLETVEPDVHLVANLLNLSHVIPAKTKDTARRVVRKVVDELEAKLSNPLIQAVRGSLHRAQRNRRPRPKEIDWPRTIRANLATYIPAKKTIIPERLIGFGHRRPSLRDVVLCVDQSGSMAPSVVYAGIFGAVLASIRALRTRMVVFDTAVVDLTDDLQDPVDLLFGTQLGGGTDIARALAYCQQIVERPPQTILVLITDLYEGGDAAAMLRRAAALAASGVQLICLLALSDQGAPGYHAGHAAALAELGIPSFACTPDLFPGLMAAAIQKQDVGMWAARNGVVTAVEADPFAVAAYKLALLTGARPGEVLSARWEDIDLGARVWKLPKGKTGARPVYLGEPAAHLLAEIPRAGAWIFPGVGKSGHLESLRDLWERTAKRAELPDGVRLYDATRHTFATIAEELDSREMSRSSLRDTRAGRRPATATATESRCSTGRRIWCPRGSPQLSGRS